MSKKRKIPTDEDRANWLRRKEHTLIRVRMLLVAQVDVLVKFSLDGSTAVQVRWAVERVRRLRPGWKYVVKTTPRGIIAWRYL